MNTSGGSVAGRDDLITISKEHWDALIEMPTVARELITAMRALVADEHTAILARWVIADQERGFSAWEGSDLSAAQYAWLALDQLDSRLLRTNR